MAEKVAITFFGGVGTPTGANYLLEKGNTKLLIDCGLFQGSKIGADENREPFSYNPSSIEYLIVTHAHLDHVGRIPKLIKEGFRGKIISTPPTKEIAEHVMRDSMRVLEKEAKKHGHEPLYSNHEVDTAMGLWITREYGKKNVVGECEVVFRDAGHILGSSFVEITFPGSEKKIVFSGDLGNTPAPLLRDTEPLKDATLLVVESVYGDRNHEAKSERTSKLKKIIVDTIEREGVLMIPAFSIERTQELLFEINNFVENKEIPAIPVFIDSPLAIKVTDVYKKYRNYFNENIKELMRGGDDIFAFPNLHFTMKREESKAILHEKSPKIIIAGSGMSNGGRIVHHEKQYLPDSNNTLLLVGYQVPGSLGRQLQDGMKKVSINDEPVDVRAQVETIHSFSAHKDSDNLLSFVEESADTLEHVYVNQGEEKSSLFLVQRIRDYVGVSATAPSFKERIEYEL